MQEEVVFDILTLNSLHIYFCDTFLQLSVDGVVRGSQIVSLVTDFYTTHVMLF
jgi:hypothetical protein